MTLRQTLTCSIPGPGYEAPTAGAPMPEAPVVPMVRAKVESAVRLNAGSPETSGRVIDFVRVNPGAAVAEIASALQLSTSRVYETAAALVRRGLLVRTEPSKRTGAVTQYRVARGAP